VLGEPVYVEGEETVLVGLGWGGERCVGVRQQFACHDDGGAASLWTQIGRHAEVGAWPARPPLGLYRSQSLD